MAFLDDMIDMLEGDLVGTYGTDIFASSQAFIPVLASGLATLHLIQTGGTAPERTHNAVLTPAYIQPTMQLTARASTHAAAFAKATAAYNSLFKIRNQFINSGWYKWVKPLGDLDDSGSDPNGQVRVSFNVIANKRP